MLGKNLIQAAAGNAAGEVLGVEDVFSTYLYTGNNSTQTITNGIDLAGEGGMVWVKTRINGFSTLYTDHAIVDTARGDRILSSNTANDDTYWGAPSGYFPSFNSNGFTVGSGSALANHSSRNYASWTFRKAAKFFDVVTYTGDGVAGKAIAHSLGSTPGFVIIKRIDSTGDWFCSHRDLANFGQHLFLNQTTAASSNLGWIGNVTSTQFQVYRVADLNTSGATYVAYVFAHDAGGFGEDGNQNVISCGSYIGNGSTQEINLGWEPQWLLVKNTSIAGGWSLFDTMRGYAVDQSVRLRANDATAEASYNVLRPRATGFELYSGNYEVNSSGNQYIYIAIRRGPMKTPTAGTEVYENVAYTGDQVANRQIGSTVLADAVLLSDRDASSADWGTFYAHYFFDRLRWFKTLSTAFTSAEVGGWSGYFSFARNIGWDTSSSPNNVYLNKTGTKYVSHNFRRAPGFFDIVAYTGTGANLNVSHNLSVTPEFLIVKGRSASGGSNWNVYHYAIGSGSSIYLNSNGISFASSTQWNNTAPTASQFTLGTRVDSNSSGQTYIAYLFATVSGVSKVGSYTGTGTTLDIDCGFTNGARFVLIKRTDSTGDWYVWDSARGIVAANDPYLLLNSNSVEVTSTDYIDPLSSGFQISSTAPAAINANGGSFIFLAIA